MGMNAKFVKTLRKYCKARGLVYSKAKNLYEKASDEEQREYREEIEQFVATREKIALSLLQKDRVVLPGSN